VRADTVIATHANTDFDAFASMLAARRLFPGAVVCLAGSLNRNLREFYRLHADELGVVEAPRLELDAIRRLIVVETVHAGRLAELEPVALDPAVDKVVFDHHAGELPDWAEPDNVMLSQDGALTTTLVGILAERDLAVEPLEATVFALGIHEDTGSLTYPSATQRDAEALAWCLRHGASQELVASFLHTPLGDEDRRLLNTLLDSLETHTASAIDVLVAAVAWPTYVDGISNLAHKVVDLTDCKGLALLVEMDSRVFLVARSRTPHLDAGVIAAALGGGGHPQAASAIFRGALADAKTKVVESLGAAVRIPLRARDVMSGPARSVSPDETVSHAMVECQRHNQSGILVTVDGRLEGLVSREDLDKAIGHGLAHAPVKAIMGGRVPTVSEDAPLAELQQLLATTREGRLAVLDGETLIGVVTRSDVLHALGEPEPEADAAESIADHLTALGELAEVFEAIAAASEPFEGVYLVGGMVRDLLLGEENFDVDVAVEGDAIALARTLADELDGRVRPHEKFGTAVVVYGEGDRHVDVATARTEFYDSPGALPAVEHATIREDLRRRDFRINAMAASLKGGDFGRVVDPFGGRRDLDERIIRVLHNLSFIDDPTRILRAIRYENRYGFRMDAHTERLARSCIEMGLVGDLSSARLGEELEALLQEGDVRHSILRLADLRLDRAIHPRLAADEEAVDLLDRLRALAQQYDIDVPDWRLALIVLARRLASDELYDWLNRIQRRRKDADQIAGAVTVAPRLVERFQNEELTAAQIVAAAEPFAPDAPLFALALAELPQLRRYFEELRWVRLEITGADLAKLGLAESPYVGEVLDDLRSQKLNGLLNGRESELAAARRLIANR
jgi:tRNA nucleotidyltransferase (CCA-adding enzyme)